MSNPLDNTVNLINDKERPISILTEPISFEQQFREFVKHIIGKHRDYGGHYAVTRSLINGLNENNYVFNYRASSQKELYDRVHVLSGTRTLRYALKQKKRGLIKYVSCGPGIDVYDSNFKNLVEVKDIDLFLTPSDWVTEYIGRDILPEIREKIFTWAAGIDIRKYTPKNDKGITRHGIIYYKRGNEDIYESVQKELRSRGYTITKFEYGSYILDEYIECLNCSDFVVVIGNSESQGLFMVEAWGMDVPVICHLKNKHTFHYKNHSFLFEGDRICCPYLNEDNGIGFHNMLEFGEIMDRWDDISAKFKPREWAINNMTDKMSAHEFVLLINNHCK